MLQTDILLTEQQVADMLGVSTAGVRKWREKRLIAYIKIGKLIRFEPEEVRAFIERNRKAPTCVCEQQSA